MQLASPKFRAITRRQDWLEAQILRFLAYARRNPVQAYLYIVGPIIAFGLGVVIPLAFKYVVAAVVGIFVIAACAINARVSMEFAWFLMVAEGAVRKWLFPGAQEFIYFGKDIVLLGLYLGTILRGYLKTQKGVPPLPGYIRTTFWILTVYLVLELFNPRLPHQIIGIFGIRNYLLYAGMVVIMPYLFESRTDFYGFLKRQFIFIIPIVVLSLVQYSFPPDHFLNKYSNDAHKIEIAVFSATADVARARVTSSFSYITGFSSYLTIMCLMLFPFFFTSGRKERWLYTVPMGLSVGGLFMTGSRGPLLMVVALAPVFIQLATFGTQNRREAKLIRNRLYKRLGVIGVLLVIMLMTVFYEPLMGVMDRFNTHSDKGDRLTRLVTEPLKTMSDAGLFGYGASVMHQGTIPLLNMTGTYAVLPPNEEEETQRIMGELGILGFLIWHILRAMFLWWNWKLIRSETDSFYRLFIISVFLIQLTCIPTSTVLNHTQLFMYWFLLSCLRIPTTRPAAPKKRRRYLL